MSRRNEAKLQDDIMADLRSLGKNCECFKIEKTSDNGVPDIFFTTSITGAVFIETKRTEGKLSSVQEFKIKKLNSCGVKAFSCYSWAEWINIKKILNIQCYIH